MKTLILCWLMMLAALTAQAQECDCSTVLRNMENEVEKNSASYQDQVVLAGRQKEYKAHKKQINGSARQIHDRNNCVALSARYLSFLHDAHLSIHFSKEYFPFSSFDDSLKVKAYFQSWPRYKAADHEFKKHPVERDWYYEDGTFSISVFGNSGTLHNYAGVIKETTQPYWQPGMLKLELESLNDSTFNCILWSQRLRPTAAIGRLSGGKLVVGRMVFYADPRQNKTLGYHLFENLDFKILSPATAYLRIPSFDLEEKKKIDSIVHVHMPEILSHTNLIIDLRGNGGGGDPAYYPLLPLIFDNRIIFAPLAPSIWCSTDNLKWYGATRYNGCENRKDSIDADAEFKQLKLSENTFSPYRFANDTLDSICKSPSHIALLVDRNCGSTTEGFILLSLQSKKIKLYGENTYGAITYGDWRRKDIAGLPIWISNTTKKMNFYTPMQVESTGIPPSVDLSAMNYAEWIEAVRKDMEK